MSDPRPARCPEHAMWVMLEERLGGAAPPDLSARIRSAAEAEWARSEPVRPERGATHAARRPRGRLRLGLRLRWWLVPVLFVLGVLGFLLLFAESPAAQFIYTMF